MTKNQLINSLWKQDLTQFTFAIWSRKLTTDKTEYTYCVGNTLEEGYECYEGKIGGHLLDKGKYSKKYIESTLFGF